MNKILKAFEKMGFVNITEPTIPIIQLHTILNFIYALNNLTMYQVFEKIHFGKEDTNTAIDLDLAKRCDWNIGTYVDHANERQIKELLLFIANDYEGISIEKVRTRFFNPEKVEA